MSENLKIIDWSLLPKNITMAYTTRQGGVSLQPYQSFNLADHVGDVPEHVASNRQHLTQRTGVPIFWLTQVHGNRAISWDHHIIVPQETPIADASYTQIPQKACAVMTADCLPLLVCDTHGKEIAAIHAGWKGLKLGVIQNTLRLFKCAPQNILVFLGAAIGPTAFQVGEELYKAFSNYRNAFTPSSIPFHYQCNLYEIARYILMQEGILSEHITGGQHCTYQEEDLFFSYRREKETGRMAHMIWMN
jgi:YfiH family protein